MRLDRRSSVALLAGLGVVALAIPVRAAGPIAGDLRASRALQELIPGLNGPMRAFSAAGGIPVLVVAIGVAGVTLLAKRRGREPLLLVAAFLSAEVVTLAFRVVTDRPRPSPSLVQVLETGPGTSFPSGHAADAAALAAVAIMMVPRHRRAVVATALGTFALLSGISRVYLGAHWLTDVAGGYLAGVAIGLALSRLLRPTTA